MDGQFFHNFLQAQLKYRLLELEAEKEKETIRIRSMMTDTISVASVASLSSVELPHSTEPKPTPPNQHRVTKAAIAAIDIPTSPDKPPTAKLESHYPDGYVCYEIPKLHNREDNLLKPSFGWKFVATNSKVLSSGQKRVYKSCLGVYKCPLCEFKEVPRQTASKKKNPIPQPPRGNCKTHPSQELIHHPCHVRMSITEAAQSWIVDHQGIHDHPKPPCIGRLDPSSSKALETVVMTAPEVTPFQLKLGTNTRPSVTEIHPSLQNMDRLRYERAKIVKRAKKKFDLVDIMKFCKDTDPNFLRKHCIVPPTPHLIMQDQDMIDLISNQECAFETDTIEGFLWDPGMGDLQQPNVTVTSTFDPCLERWVPVCISILFGKSTADYTLHWDQFFRCLPYTSWQLCKGLFPGNTSDFSDAIRKAFTISFKKYASNKFGETLSSEDVTQFYSFCDVHFQRSRRRINKNRHIVPTLEDELQFHNMIEDLFTYKQGQHEMFRRQCLKILRYFPKAKNWLNWYLHPDRAVILFDACKLLPSSTQLQKDTNAQENVGRQIQYGAPKAKLGIGEAFEHLWRFCNNLKMDRSSVKAGTPVQYGKSSSRKKKRKRLHLKQWTNDGRAPDTTDKLLAPSTKKARTVLSGNIFSGIPWSFNWKGQQYTNTCRLDCVLTLLYMIHQQQSLTKDLNQADSSIHKGLDLLACGSHIEARMLWKRPDAGNDTSINWWGELNDTWEMFGDIHGFTVESKYTCSKCGKTKKKSSDYTEVSIENVQERGWLSNLQSQAGSGLRKRMLLTDGCCGRHNVQCKGPSTQKSKVVSWKGLIVLTVLEQKQTILDIPKVARIGRKKIGLRGTINHRGGHFTSWILTQNVWWFYDGMAKPMMKRLRNEDTATVQCYQGEGTAIVSVVYQILEEDRTEVPDAISLISSSSSSSNSNNISKEAIFSSARKKVASNASAKKTGRTRKIGKTRKVVGNPVKKEGTPPWQGSGGKKQKRKPIGFSYQAAASHNKKGRLPLCTGCGMCIERHEERIYHSFYEHRDNKFSTVNCYHFKVKCLGTMSRQQIDDFCNKKWSEQHVRGLRDDLDNSRR